MSQPRISRLNRTDVDASIVSVFDDSLRERGNVPYFFRTLAHRPSIMTTAWAHMQAVLAEGTLPRALKELAVVRTSQLNRTPYCLASHTMMAKKLGCDDAKLDALADYATSDQFDVRERLALHLAEVMTADPHGYTDADFAKLRGEFSEGEVIELVAAIGLFNYFNRANDLLQMETTKPATAEELEAAGLVAAR
ncbi:MAG: carboxymuconolactone decarboxylase family protein [Janthinobacterium lividum]